MIIVIQLSGLNFSPQPVSMCDVGHDQRLYQPDPSKLHAGAIDTDSERQMQSGKT